MDTNQEDFSDWILNCSKTNNERYFNSLDALVAKYTKLSEDDACNVEVDLNDFTVYNNDNEYLENMEYKDFAFTNSYCLPMEERLRIRKMQKALRPKMNRRTSGGPRKWRHVVCSKYNVFRKKNKIGMKKAYSKQSKPNCSDICSGTNCHNLEENSLNIAEGLDSKNAKQLKRKKDSEMSDDSVFPPYSEDSNCDSESFIETSKNSNYTDDDINESLQNDRIITGTNDKNITRTNEGRFRRFCKSPKRPRLKGPVVTEPNFDKNKLDDSNVFVSVTRNYPNGKNSFNDVSESITPTGTRLKSSVSDKHIFGDTKNDLILKDSAKKKINCATLKKTKFKTSVESQSNVGFNTCDLVLNNDAHERKINFTTPISTKLKKSVRSNNRVTENSPGRKYSFNDVSESIDKTTPIDTRRKTSASDRHIVGDSKNDLILNDSAEKKMNYANLEKTKFKTLFETSEICYSICDLVLNDDACERKINFTTPISTKLRKSVRTDNSVTKNSPGRKNSCNDVSESIDETTPLNTRQKTSVGVASNDLVLNNDACEMKINFTTPISTKLKKSVSRNNLIRNDSKDVSDKETEKKQSSKTEISKRKCDNVGHDSDAKLISKHSNIHSSALEKFKQKSHSSKVYSSSDVLGLSNRITDELFTFKSPKVTTPFTVMNHLCRSTPRSKCNISEDDLTSNI